MEVPGGDALALATERVEALRAWLAAADGAPVRLIETHISWVLLARTLVYKVKKPVRLPFLDFTTLAARRRFCDEELRLNRRLAPSLYLDVVEIRDSPQGPVLAGTGPVLDVAVRMRRFPDGALWSEMLTAGTLAASHVDALARKLADFHRDAAVAPPGSAFGSAACHAGVTRGLVDAVQTLQDEAVAAGPPGLGVDWPALRDWLARQQEVLAPLWASRLEEGRVRECHGDLHLANVVQLGSEATAFDGIEFSDEMRWIDVLEDMAFVAMDLMANGPEGGRRDLAFRFVNAYLAASGDYAGLPALRFHLVCRALVRAQVAALGDRHGTGPSIGCGARRYLALASALSHSAGARLAITHGLPGSGKSTLAQGVIEAAGAIGVRSDVERKRLFGLSALQSSHDHAPGSIYAESATRQTYSRLHEVARTALGAGWPVVVDAAFLLRSDRAAFAALAGGLSAPFSIFECRAGAPVLRLRLEQRQDAGTDPSEADVAVLERLAVVDEALAGWERGVAIVVDAAQPQTPEAAATRWLAAA